LLTAFALEVGVLYKGFGRNLPYLEGASFRLIYLDVIERTYLGNGTVKEIVMREKCGLLAVPLIVPVLRGVFPYTPQVRP